MGCSHTKARGGLLVQQIALVLYQINCHKPYAEEDIWRPDGDRGDFLQWIEVKDEFREDIRPMVARKFILDFSRRCPPSGLANMSRLWDGVGYIYLTICGCYHWCKTGDFWTASLRLCVTILAYSSCVSIDLRRKSRRVQHTWDYSLSLGFRSPLTLLIFSRHPSLSYMF